MALPNKTKIPVGYVLQGKYRITREIGRGGMAAVYEAENVDIGKRVAIKVLAQELTSSAVVVERFLREARAAAAIRSPYICDVYDSGRLEDGRPFLVLELLEGESLYEQMTRVRHMDVPTTLNVITQTCRGLTKAHASSIVHRDLKPENIFLTKDEEGNLLAKILDFGLAKFYAPMEGSSEPKQARLTREGAVFGTPAYMSPEQVRGQGAVDHRADLWALGCITYECLTGKTVWATEQGVAMTFAQIANSPLPRPAKLRPDLPTAFTEWFDRALDRNIEKRFQSAKEFAEELAAAFEQHAPSYSHLESLPTLGASDVVEVRESAVTTKAKRPGEPPTRKVPADAPTQAPPMPLGGALPHATLEGDVPVFLSEPPPPPGAGAAPPRPSPPRPPAPPPPRAPEASPAPTSGTPAPPSPHPTPSSPTSAPPKSRAVVVIGVLAVMAAGAYAGWRQFAGPTPGGLQVSSATVEAGAPTVAPTGPTTTAAVASSAVLPWRPMVGEAQQLVAQDNLKGAAKVLADAFEKGGSGVPKTLREQAQVALAIDAKAPCRVTGLARPRTYDLATATPKYVGAGRPSIAVGSRGPLMTWTDAHEGSEHAYAVALDPAMRNAGDPIDVTPEGAAIGRPELLAVGEKYVLTYWDSRGGEAGVHVRWIDADGRIGGPSVAVAPYKAGNFWPSLARLGDGSFFVAWTNEGDADSEDLFLRALSPSLDPVGEITRATDLVASGSKPRVRIPAIAASKEALHVSYRLERDPLRLIQNQRMLVSEAKKGLGDGKLGPRGDRFLGESALVNTDKAKADGPSLACGDAGCFVVWHGEQSGGASAAYLDPGKATPLWRRKFSRLGAHPAVSVAPSGQAQIAWYERGGVMVAAINRDGVGTPTKIARVLGDQPMPSIAPGGKPGEWYVAWLDFEIGHLEPYAARVVCK